jgi:hypothetical protein
MYSTTNDHQCKSWSNTGLYWLLVEDGRDDADDDTTHQAAASFADAA